MRIQNAIAIWILFLLPALWVTADEVGVLETRLAGLVGIERLPLITSLVEAYEKQDSERAIALALEGLELLEEQPDARIELDLTLSLASAYANTDQALLYGRRAEKLARTEGNDPKLAAALTQIGSTLEQSDYSAAVEAFREAETIYLKIGDRASRAQAIHSTGRAYFRQGKHQLAAEEFLRTLSAYTELDDEAGEARALSNIGSVYSRIGQTEKALTNFRQALAIYRRLNLSERIAGTLNNIGLSYLRSEEPAQAADYFSKAIATMEGIDNDRYLANMYNNMGMSLRNLGQLPEAKSYLQRSIEIKDRLGDRRGQIDSLINVASVDHFLGDTASALSTAEQARDLALEMESPVDLENVYKVLALIYSDSGRNRQALEAFTQHKALYEERYNENNSKIIAEMTTRYESEKKQLEIERLEHRQRLADLELRRRQDQQQMVAGGSIGFTLLALGLAYAFWQRKTVAQERKVNQRLRQVDKLKDEFLANTSHELRTPLHGITGIVESLIEGATGPLPEATQKNLEMVVASGRRLSHLVGDILDFSKLRHKSLELDRRPVELYAVVDVVLTLSAGLVGSKDLRLVNAVARELPAADADENRLQQILYNLIGNAIKFTEKGRVEVSAIVENERLTVRVTDTGIGIAEEQKARIFDVFEQADASVEREYGGTGLGLAVTRQLVELHGGEIRVESSPAKGSVFAFTLPVAEATPLAGEPEAQLHPIDRAPTTEATVELPQSVAAKAGEGKARILAVDDDPINLQVLRNYLATEDFDLTLASSGEEALNLLEEQTFDLVLLDVMMPKISGYEVCRALRENHPIAELPVLFLTAKSQDSDVEAGIAQGANDYLTKPISKRRLLARVEPHLEVLNVHRHLEEMVDEKISQIKVLQGLLPICSGCKKIRDDEGYWNQLEIFINRHSEAEFTHGICPECVQLYLAEHPELGSSQ